MQELRRLSPVHKGASKSPIAGLGLGINAKYEPKQKDKPKAVQKASPKVRHRRKSALKKSATFPAQQDGGGGAEGGSPGSGNSVSFSDEAEDQVEESRPAQAGSANGGANGGASAKSASTSSGKARSKARGKARKAPSKAKGGVAMGGADAADDEEEEEASEYEFDYDAGGNEGLVGTGREEKEAYKRHIPLKPLQDLEPLHHIIPLEELLQEDQLEEQMVVSTKKFNATVRLFKDRERKYQEAIQILEERNRTLSKIVVERDNVVAYLQAKLQSPTKRVDGHRGGAGGGLSSYRELDLDEMDAEEYPMLGMRNTQMPNISGLTSYIERPSPSFSSYQPRTKPASPATGSLGGALSASSLVDTVYSSPFKQEASSIFDTTDSLGASGGGGGGLFSSRFAGDLRSKSPATPASGSKKFERRLTKFDKSSIFSKYT